MPQREVAVTLATFVDEDGFRQFGLQGSTVHVHPDHVERFDQLNVVPGLAGALADVAEQFAAIGETAEKLNDALTNVAELVAGDETAEDQFAAQVVEDANTVLDQAAPGEPAETEPVADVLELDTSAKRSRRRGAASKGE